MFKQSFTYIFLLSSIFFYAQETPVAEQLEEVILQENRLQIPFEEATRNIQVIGKETIKKLPISSVNEALSYVLGIDVRQRGPFGSQADVSIDGGSFEQTIILWNGVKISDVQTAHHSLNLPIPLHAIERIEIIKGPASRMYGINALTGAINIVTKTSYTPFVNIHAYGGSSFKKKDKGDGSGIYAGGGVEASAGISIGKTQHLFALATEKANGQRYNTASENKKALYQGNYKLNDKNFIDVMGGYVANEFGANAYYAAPYDKEAYELVNTLVTSVGSKHYITDNLIIKPRLSNRYNEDDYRFYRDDISKARSQHYTNAFMAELHGVYTSAVGDFGFGYEARFEEVNSSNLGKHERKNQGWFAEYKTTLFDNLLLNAGAYFNYNTDYGFDWYPGIELAYTLPKHWKINVNLGSSQRIPSFTDLYLNQRPGNIGNPNLQPEAAWQYEAGATYKANGMYFYAGAFLRDISNFIDWTRIVPEEPYQPFNVGNQKMRGLHVSWQQNLKITKNDVFTYQVNYQYLSPKKEDRTNELISKYVLESLKHQAIIGVSYTKNKYLLSWQNRWIKRELNDAYWVSDIKLSYRMPQLELYTQVSNLFNTRYTEAGAVPMPTRWVNLGLRYQIGL
ncbi:iron complex outermembrane receptor protein [Mesonia hippocampi]|uniref:Iron complex outermembrane receptor protein n=1 Tax=Mesonia hippocampi TaxID=1628250 RepID=A0A840EKA9_9FLAO|nr:TonB-dependent receptor [Mesonia hippocampi]MBB4118578.1 iron complex outermembrane receptor protein [Mesonia hippocampi]